MAIPSSGFNLQDVADMFVPTETDFLSMYQRKFGGTGDLLDFANTDNPTVSNTNVSNVGDTSAGFTFDVGSTGGSTTYCYVDCTDINAGTTTRFGPTSFATGSHVILMQGLDNLTSYSAELFTYNGFRNEANAIAVGTDTFQTTSGYASPSVTTYSTTITGATTATLRMGLALNEPKSHQYRWRYRPSGGSWTYTSIQNTSTGGTKTFGITGLNLDTTYEVQAQATATTLGGSETVNGSFVNFAINSPSVSTYNPTNVGGTSATLEAYMVLNESLTHEYRFRYRVVGGSWSYTSWTNITSNGYPDQTVSGLNSGTSYEYQAIGRFDNHTGDDVYGTVTTFTTTTASPDPNFVSLFENGSFSQITWSEPALGAPNYYNVYVIINGVAQYIGQATSSPKNFDICLYGSNLNTAVPRVDAVYSGQTGSDTGQSVTISNCGGGGGGIGGFE